MNPLRSLTSPVPTATEEAELSIEPPFIVGPGKGTEAYAARHDAFAVGNPYWPAQRNPTLARNPNPLVPHHSWTDEAACYEADEPTVLTVIANDPVKFTTEPTRRSAADKAKTTIDIRRTAAGWRRRGKGTITGARSPVGGYTWRAIGKWTGATSHAVSGPPAVQAKRI